MRTKHLHAPVLTSLMELLNKPMQGERTWLRVEVSGGFCFISPGFPWLAREGIEPLFSEKSTN